MLFGLKKVEATYQRLVNKMFKDILEKNVQAYINDILVKSTSYDQHLKDLQKAFDVFERHNTNLNIKKCAFAI